LSRIEEARNAETKEAGLIFNFSLRNAKSKEPAFTAD